MLIEIRIETFYKAHQTMIRLKKDGKKMMDLPIPWHGADETCQSDVKLEGSLNTFLQRTLQLLHKHQAFKIINVSL